MKSFLSVFVILLNFYIKQSLGEEEIEESNARHFIEGKVIIQGDKLPGIYSDNSVVSNGSHFIYKSIIYHVPEFII